MKKFEMRFGAFVPTLAAQIEQQGFKLRRIDVAHHQRDVDAVTRLAVRGILSEAESRRARQRLVNRIAKTVKPLNHKPDQQCEEMR